MKVVLQPERTAEVLLWLRLHPACFREAFPERVVRNVYLDSPELISLQQNLGGLATRSKLRLRWYGQAASAIRACLELKCKRDAHGWKVQQPFDEPMVLEGRSWSNILQDLRQRACAPLKHQLQIRCCPVVINAYHRRYFESADGHVRATLDHTVQCFDQRLSPKPNLTRRHPGAGVLVLELKAAVHHRAELAEVASCFPARLQRCSKYQQSLESLLAYLS